MKSLSPHDARKTSSVLAVRSANRLASIAMGLVLPVMLAGCETPNTGPISWIKDVAEEVIPGVRQPTQVAPVRRAETAAPAPAPAPQQPPQRRATQQQQAPQQRPSQQAVPPASSAQGPTIVTIPSQAPVTTEVLPPPPPAAAPAPPATAPATVSATAETTAPSVVTAPASEPVLRLRPPGDASVRIGMLVPLSGINGSLGRAMLDAAQMAIFDLGDERIVLLPRDAGDKPEDSAKAAEDLLSAGIDVLVGPLLAGSVQAVTPLARSRNITVLSFSSDRNVAGNGTYILGFTPDQQIDRVVAFAKSRGITRIGALTPDTPYGQLVSASLKSATARNQIATGRSETYPADTADLTPVVRRFTAAELRRAENEPAIDALLLPEGGARLRTLAPLLPYFDLDPRRVKFIGTGLWDDAATIGEPALQGGWFASPDPQGFNEFRQRFESQYGRRPPRIASIAYDAVALAGVLGRDSGANAFTPAAIGSADGYTGYDGLFRFRPDGVVERGLAVIEVQARGFRTLDPAPVSFVPRTN